VYSRTQNEDGTFNTRCLYCFRTVGIAVKEESELEIVEKAHMCPERALAQMLESSISTQTSHKPN
jgi:hypothetical protein